MQRWPTAATFLDRHKARHHFRRCLWSRRDHTGGYQPPRSKRVRTALHGRLLKAISKSLRPSHRRSFRSAFYLWHTPTLVDFKHLADFTRHRELIPGPARASLFSRRHRLLVDVGKQPEAAAFREYVPAARRVAVSSRSIERPISPFEHTSSGYPFTKSCPDSAPSPHNLTSKPLRAFHG